MSEESVRLNIGAGQTFIPGMINIDISPQADVSLDLGRDPLPFESSSVDLIFSYHTLEHVQDYLFALGEIHRVLKHQGIFLVGLPYATSTKFHMVNPYHLHDFTENSFKFFDPGQLRGSAAEGDSPSFVEVFHRLHYMDGFRSLPSPIRNWCRNHLLNVVKKIDFGLVALKDTATSPPAASEAELRGLFDELLDARRDYGPSS